MNSVHLSPTEQHVHSWLRPICLSFVPGQMSPLLEVAVPKLLDMFRSLGHTVQDVPDEATDLILTTAPFAQPLNWRDSLLFTSRRRFGLKHAPTILTLIPVTPDELRRMLDHFEQALHKIPRDPADFAFPGLAPSAFDTLIEQGARGGPVMALERLLQAQIKSIRIILLVGDDRPDEAYTFDLVGAHPRTDGADEAAFYRDIALRIATVMSTGEITNHEVVGAPIPAADWQAFDAPTAMLNAARELGKRHFFTQTVEIAKLVAVPSIGDAVADQYSEGCFGTWEPRLPGLIATITGSARPVDKDNITENDLAVIVGVRPGGKGAQVRHVAGHRNDPPSSEAVEMIALDEPLPKVTVEVDGKRYPVPVARSKLHGHRGVAAFDPTFVEYVPLDLPYYHYPVSCSTEAQAHGIYEAFSRSETLRNPDDSRLVAFTILPGHGVVVVEKWQADKLPFQVIWEYMDAGYLEVESDVPQGPLTFEPDSDGRLRIHKFL